MNTDIDTIIEDLVMIAKEQININYPIQIEELKPYIVSFNSDFKDLSLFDMCFELGKFLIEMLDYHSEIFSDEQLYNKFAARFLFPQELFVDNCRKFMKNGKVNCTKVAEYYKVPIKVIVLRGMELNLWT